MSFKVIDLFCGAGGMSEGILQAGLQIVYSNDVNEQVGQTYQHRHEQIGLIQGKNTYFECEDIRNIHWVDIQEKMKGLSAIKWGESIEIDAIFGGPPCQGFSRAGKRMKNDPRNFLFKEYLRLIHEIQPKYVVMENVSGLLDTKLDGFVGVFGDVYPDDTLVTKLLSSEFDRIGYNHLIPRILDASEYGVPQRRRRVIYLAYRKDMEPPSYPSPTTPNPEDKVTVHDAISDLMMNEAYKPLHKKRSNFQQDAQKGRTITSTTKQVLNHELSSHDAVITERFKLFRYGESQAVMRKRMLNGFDISTSQVLIDKVRNELHPELNDEQIIEKCKKDPTQDIVELILTKKNSRLRLSPTETAPTMLSSGDDYIHPYEPRGLTVREMARLQSFDDSFTFLGKRTTGGLRRRVEVPQYTQVGNAVPPLLAKAVALEIKQKLEALNKNNTN